jgi:hypothetical protein
MYFPWNYEVLKNLIAGADFEVKSKILIVSSSILSERTPYPAQSSSIFFLSSHCSGKGVPVGLVILRFLWSFLSQENELLMTPKAVCFYSHHTYTKSQQHRLETFNIHTCFS